MLWSACTDQENLHYRKLDAYVRKGGDLTVNEGDEDHIDLFGSLLENSRNSVTPMALRQTLTIQMHCAILLLPSFASKSRRPTCAT